MKKINTSSTVNFVNYRQSVGAIPDALFNLVTAIGHGDINKVIIAVDKQLTIPSSLVDLLKSNLEFAGRKFNRPASKRVSPANMTLTHASGSEHTVVSRFSGVITIGDTFGNDVSDLLELACTNGAIVISPPLSDGIKSNLPSDIALIDIVGCHRRDGTLTFLMEITSKWVFSSTGAIEFKTNCISDITTDGLEAVYNYLLEMAPDAARKFGDDILDIERKYATKVMQSNVADDMLLSPTCNCGDISYKLSLIRDKLLINVICPTSVIHCAMVRGVNVTSNIDSAVRYINSVHLAPVKYLDGLRTKRDMVKSISELPKLYGELPRLLAERFSGPVYLVNNIANPDVQWEPIKELLTKSVNWNCAADTNNDNADTRNSVIVVTDVASAGVYDGINVTVIDVTHDDIPSRVLGTSVVSLPEQPQSVVTVSQATAMNLINVALKRSAMVYWMGEVVTANMVKNITSIAILSDTTMVYRSGDTSTLFIVEQYDDNAKTITEMVEHRITNGLY